MIKPTYKTLLSEKQFLQVQKRARELRKYGTHLVNIFYDDSRLIFKTRSSTGDPRLIWTQTIELADIDIDQLIKMNGKIDYRTFLLTGLRIDCNCYAFLYYGYRYMAWKRGYGLVKETRIPRVRNPYQRGFCCFAPGTPVFTATGYKPIEDIKVGDLVFTHKGRLRRVVANSSHLADETVKVRVGSDWIQCTPNHPFLGSKNLSKSCPSTKKFNTDIKFAPIKEFQPGDFFVSPRLELGEERRVVDSSDAFMLGLYLGDGTLQCVESKGKSQLQVGKFRAKGDLGIAFAYEFKDQYQKYFDRCGYNYRTAQTSDNGGIFYIKDPELRKFCLQYGNFTNSNLNQTKILNPEVLSWDKQSQFEIIRGFFLADGTVVKGAGKSDNYTSYITLFNTNYQVISMLHIILSQWYDCSVDCYQRKPFVEYGRVVEAQPMYFIRFTGKQAADLYQRLGWVVNCKGQLDHRFSNYECNSYCIDDTKYTPKIIKEIVPAGQSIVYNFEVEGDNSYIVNGLAVHNCKHLYLVLSCLPFLAQTLQSKFGKYISKRKQELAAQQKKQDSVLRQKVQQVMNPVYDADLRYQQQVQQAVQARQELDKLQAPQYDLLNPEASAEEQRPQQYSQQYLQNPPDYDPNLDLEPDFSDEDEESIYKIIQEDNGQ